MSNSFFLVGYYGFGNAGDEFLLRHVSSYLTRRFPGCSLDVFRRRSLVGFFRSLRHCDTLVFGGGEVFQDQTSRRSLWFYFGIVIAGLMCGKQVWLLMQGFSPFRYASSRWLARRLLSRVAHLSVRDDASRRALISLGIEPSRIIMGADLGFSNPDLFYNKGSVDGVLGACLRRSFWSCFPDDYRADWAPKMGFLAIQPSEDFEVLSGFSKDQTGLDLRIDLQDSLLDNAPIDTAFCCVVSMRYHACVWAALQGIPFIGLVGHQKVQSLCQELGQPFVILSDSFCDQEIAAYYQDIRSNYSEYQDAVISRRDHLHQRVLEGLQSL